MVAAFDGETDRDWETTCLAFSIRLASFVFFGLSSSPSSVFTHSSLNEWRTVSQVLNDSGWTCVLWGEIGVVTRTMKVSATI